MAVEGRGKSRVAPFAGAWIESSTALILSSVDFVAPFAGAWIESECRS